MTAVLIFVAAILGLWAFIVALGYRTAIALTPWVLLTGGFLLPGLGAATMPLAAAWMCALVLLAHPADLVPSIAADGEAARAFLLVLALMSATIAYSPARGEGVRMVAQGMIGLFAVVAFRLGLRYRTRLDLLRRLNYALGALAVGVMLCRIAPAIEAAFYNSRFAGVFIDAGTLHDAFHGYWDQANNVNDPGKAGAVFVNANVASAQLAMGFGVVVGLLRSPRRERWMWPTCMLLAAGILATGSRAGLLSLVLVALVALRMGRTRVAWLVGAGALTLIVAVVAMVFAGQSLGRFAPDTLMRDPRLLIWPLALQRFAQNPILGSGFGDWAIWLAARLKVTGIGRAFPPHNIFLQLGLWGGALLVGVSLRAMYLLHRLIKRRIALGGQDGALALGAGLAAFATLIHAMVDNFFLFEWHIGAFFFAFLALLLSAGQAPTPSSAEDVLAGSQARFAEPST